MTTRKSAAAPIQNGNEALKADLKNDLASTKRQRLVTGMNLTAPNDILRLRELLSPEYETLAARQDELLKTSHGQYVLIHQKDVKVHPTLDSALEDGYVNYSNDLFFVGRVDEQELKEYLA